MILLTPPFHDRMRSGFRMFFATGLLALTASDLAVGISPGALVPLAGELVLEDMVV